jgi:putative FmdB family regulatory protein
MPIYEYRCQQCGGTVEYQQRMSDEPKTVCEKCGGQLERLISRTAFTLKGGGWYKDLYSSPKPGDSKPAESKSDRKPAESKSDSKSAESKSDRKPAESKSDGKPAESKPAPAKKGSD